MDEYFYDLDSGRIGRAKRKKRRRKIALQKIIGFLMLLLAVVFIALVYGTHEDSSGAVLIGAIGLYLMFTRRIELR